MQRSLRRGQHNSRHVHAVRHGRICATCELRMMLGGPGVSSRVLPRQADAGREAQACAACLI